MHRIFYIAGWGFVAICAALIVRATGVIDPAYPAHVPGDGLEAVEVVEGRVPTAEEWFRRAKPYCNAVEIGFIRSIPAPGGVDGAGFEAACFALAGRTDDSRRIIDGLSPNERARAAGIVFNVGHPIADAGDDRAAGPIMELVVDYWPNHYMALYHAGMAEYMLGQSALARKNLEAFRRIYTENDGWRSNADDILRRLADPAGAAAKDLRRPKEPS
jgi:hypothetical protein